MTSIRRFAATCLFASSSILALASFQGCGGDDSAVSGGNEDAATSDTGSPLDAGTDSSARDSAADAHEDSAVPPTITSFTASPGVIPAGATRTATLAWTVTGASSLSISGIGTVTGTSTTASVSTATTYTLTATSASGGVATASAPVIVDDGTIGVYIDPVNGHDGAPGDGTPAHPYQTFHKAAMVATSGKTVFTTNGTYSVSTDTIADGVGIEAIAQGMTTLTGTGTGIIFAGGGFVHGMILSNCELHVAAGTVNVSGTQFTNFGDPSSADESAINVDSTGHVVLTPGGVANYIVAPDSSIAYLSGSGVLDVNGGTFGGLGANVFSGSAAINANGTSHVNLDGVTFSNGQTGALLMQASSVLTMQDASLITVTAQTSGSTKASIIMGGTSTATIDNSSITMSPSSGIDASGAAAPVITLQNGAIISGSTTNGIVAGGAAALTLNNAHLTTATGTGALFSGAGTLTTTAGSSINGNGNGINLGSLIASVTLRGTQVMNNTNDGIVATGLPASAAIDLGNTTTAGGNTFQGNNGDANLNLTASLSAADLTVNAVGNTWALSTQGTDAAGTFATGTTPFSAPPSVTGANVKLTQSNGGSGKNLILVVAAP